MNKSGAKIKKVAMPNTVPREKAVIIDPAPRRAAKRIVNRYRSLMILEVTNSVNVRGDVRGRRPVAILIDPREGWFARRFLARLLGVSTSAISKILRRSTQGDRE
jgi:hypothetical protein